MPPIAIVYEHPAWLRPLFDTLERRGISYLPLHADELSFDPAGSPPPAPVIFNRIAMSSFLRAPEHPIFFGQALMAHWAARGARVINGAAAMAVDSSKARQLSLIAGLGVGTPQTRVVHRTADLPSAAEGMSWPLVVKANIGGSGAGIVRYHSPAELAAAVEAGTVPDSVDRVLLVQDYVPARGGTIVRVETLAGRFLYAIEVAGDGSFDLCPADACQIGSRISMRQTQIAPDVIDAAERIVQAAGIDVGGVELMIDDRDGTARFYDINAMSNFVADPLNVLGWDPHDRLADWIETLIAGAKA